MVYQYDASAGLILTSLRIGHTVTPHVLKRVEFWLCFCLHLAIIYGFHTGVVPKDSADGGILYIPWKDMKIISAMTTFFEVFYTNECYARYMDLYKTMNQMFAAGFDFCFQLRLYARAAGMEYVLLPTRWLDASFLLFFWQLKGNEVTTTEFDKLHRAGLLRKQERDFLENHSIEQVHLILLQWCAEVATSGTAEAKTPNNVNKSLISELVTCHNLQLELMDTLELPVPFQYFHLLCLMISINLILWAYGMGTTDSYFAPVVFYFAALIFVGMMELASQLSNPFGEDEVDFPIDEWLTQFFSDQLALVQHQYPTGSANVKDNWKATLDAEATFTWDARHFYRGSTGQLQHSGSSSTIGNSGPISQHMPAPQGGYAPMGPVLSCMSGNEIAISPLSSPGHSPRAAMERVHLLEMGSASPESQKWIL